MSETCSKRGREWSKLSVKDDLRIIVNRIAADQNKFVYNLTEEVFRERYPTYFKN